MSSALVLLAAGSGTRVGAERNKVLLGLADESDTVLGRSVATALRLDDVHRLVLVIRDGDQDEVATAVTPLLGPAEARVCLGGPTRHASETAALETLRPEIEAGEIDVVVLHDAARPLAPASLFETVIATARTQGGAVPAVELTHLVPRHLTSGFDGVVVGVQTPQAFRARELLAAYDQAGRDGFAGTDTAACLERYAPQLRIARVPGEARNLKVTYAEDLATAARLSGDD